MLTCIFTNTTYIHTHTRAHTHKHTHKHTYKPRNPDAHIFIAIHTHTQTHIHTYIHKHWHARYTYTVHPHTLSYTHPSTSHIHTQSNIPFRSVIHPTFENEELSSVLLYVWLNIIKNSQRAYSNIRRLQ